MCCTMRFSMYRAHEYCSWTFLRGLGTVCITFHRLLLQAGKLGERLAAKGLQLQLDKDALAFLADRGFDPAFGARPVKRAIQRELESPLAKVLSLLH